MRSFEGCASVFPSNDGPIQCHLILLDCLNPVTHGAPIQGRSKRQNCVRRQEML
jgi:hypothetical protein